MAEADRSDGGPATPPRVLPLLLLYTLGRIVIAAALISIIWVAGLPGFPALLFGLLLSMPISFLVLRPVRERLIEAWMARRDAKRDAKVNLRARLSGTDTEQSR
jgi:antibiotic biosynthesis monooxygenase (ABM) superfamily enzyme